LLDTGYSKASVWRNDFHCLVKLIHDLIPFLIGLQKGASRACHHQRGNARCHTPTEPLRFSRSRHFSPFTNSVFFPFHHDYTLLLILIKGVISTGVFVYFSVMGHSGDANTQLKEFGGNLRRTRVSRKITQEELAEKADLHIRSLQKIEAGEINVLVTTLIRLRQGLDCPWHELLPAPRQQK
jgi:DNA-binding XRE family transcriptional regulator